MISGFLFIVMTFALGLWAGWGWSVHEYCRLREELDRERDEHNSLKEKYCELADIHCRLVDRDIELQRRIEDMIRIADERRTRRQSGP